MSEPNPYEAPRFLSLRRPVPRPKPSGWAGCLSAILGAIGGALCGAAVFQLLTGKEVISSDISAEIVTLVSGVAGAMLAPIAGYFLRLALAEPPELPDLIEIEIEAKRQKLRAEIAVADGLLVQARKDGDEEVRTKLATYRAGLEQKLRTLPERSG